MLHLFNDFYLLRPWSLLLVPIFIIFAIYYFINTKTNKNAANFIDNKLINEINITTNKNQSTIFHQISIITSIIIALIAISGPSKQTKYDNFFSNDQPIAILLDISWSMNSVDLIPTRLDRAKFKINDFLKTQKNDRSTLIIFSKNPLVVTPFTSDINTITNFLTTITPEIAPEYGDNLMLALIKANELFENIDSPSRNILLFTDSVSTNEIDDYKKYIEKNNLIVGIVGVGKAKAPILINSTGKHLTDNSGSLVFSQYDYNSIKNLANSSKNIYATEVSLNQQDISNITNFFKTKATTKLNNYSQQLKSADKSYIYYVDFGFYILILAALFLLPVFRQGIILFLLFFIYTPKVQAISFLQSNDQLAYKQYQQGNYQQAEKLFDNIDWKAVSAYKAKDYQKAEQLLTNRNDAASIYNRANAMAQQLKINDAIKEYDKVLQKKDINEELIEKTKFNKKLLEKFQQQQNQNNNQQEEQNEQKKQDNDAQENDKKGNNENNKQNSANPNQDNGKQPLANGESQPEQDQQIKNNDNQKNSPQQEEEKQQNKNKQQNSSEQQNKQSKVNQNQPNLTDIKEGENEDKIPTQLLNIENNPGLLLKRKFELQNHNKTNKTINLNEI